jgi:putative acetyltransferase
LPVRTIGPPNTGAPRGPGGPEDEAGAVIIRRETSDDVDAIRTVTTAAFAPLDRPDAPVAEATLVDALRAHSAWLPKLSLVAVDPNGEVVGHVLCTRGHVGSVPALAAAPLSVRPDRQRAGIGSALMHAVLGAADALGEPLVALLGDPKYYDRFGFRPSLDHHIAAPVAEWEPHFQVRTLTAFNPRTAGTFTYPAPFDQL